jgi:hypothetical protein
MSSKKIQPASAPVFSTSLAYHLKPRPIEADLKVDRKDRRSRERNRRGFRVGGRGGAPGAKAGAGPKVEPKPKPEPVAGWVTRAEARSLLGIEEAYLVELIARFRLRHSLVEVFSKPEILALREIVGKLK